jgi:hypothetical protein
VEDEPSVRHLACGVLAAQSYEHARRLKEMAKYWRNKREWRQNRYPKNDLECIFRSGGKLGANQRAGRPHGCSLHFALAGLCELQFLRRLIWHVCLDCLCFIRFFHRHVRC